MAQLSRLASLDLPPARRDLPWITFAVAASAATVFALPAAAPLLESDRHAVLAGGELWRLFSGHLAHWSTPHLAPDLGALLLLGWVAETRDRRRLGLLLIAAATVISVVLLRDPTWSTYRGLSGLDAALYVYVAVTVWREGAGKRRPTRALAIALLAAFVVKLIVEGLSGAALFMPPGDARTVVVSAHVSGALVGLWFACS
jgi:rhomboid family GlyGly-CTERM serine protease